MTRQQFIASLFGLWLASGSDFASGDEPFDFARDVQPLLSQHCTKCHGGVRREGGLSLLATLPAEAAGDSGRPLIVAGKPTESELFRRVTSSDADERMPAEGPPLTAIQIDTFRRWIEQGGDWPKHWSLRPLAARAPPDVAGAGWGRTAIDHFVLAGLKAANVTPSPEADRYTLIRRLSLDLLGLPSSLDEADGFVFDKAPDAYERLVDRLLANPHFGERWGRHWLDKARYADSDGYEVDKPRPDAYRWRDWVIDAVNRDRPLDQFTIEQFAGDLLPEATPLQRLATAYHRQTLTNNEGGVDKEEYRLKAVLDRVSNTGTVWLGLTLGCAQCHDHPYDPFTQREFYALAAIFNNADETDIQLEGENPSGARPLKFRVLAERDAPRTTRILKRGEFLDPGEEVHPGLLEGPHRSPHAPREESVSRSETTTIPVDRLNLARWLVDPANPLTPRVLVNQVWLPLFGQGLVRTPDDFGARGEAPTHPELLDWLGGELLVRGWSRKAIIRQIVGSSLYRQASRHRPELSAFDPQNRLLARQNRMRVEAELVRDLYLAASRSLSGKIGGPSVFPPLSEEFVKITFRSQLPWKTSTGADGHRRGMYTFFKRSVPYPDLMLFDCPDASLAAAQRDRSNTPLQALLTLNSETCMVAARGLASRAVAESPRENDAARIRWMMRICLCRPPNTAEIARLSDLLQANRDWYKTHREDAEAMTADLPTASRDRAAVAALVATASVIMNLDEFITRE